jgi:hypothetical protein
MKRRLSQVTSFHRRELFTLAILIFFGGNAWGANIDSISNFIVIKSFKYDTLASKLRVSWCVDSNLTTKDSVGITYSTDKTYLDFPPDQVLSSTIIEVTSPCQDTVINLRGGLQFDSTYYISIWLKRDGGSWLRPSDSSNASLKMPHFTREIVKFFETNDTVKAFNRTVFLWKDSHFSGSTNTDTIIAYNNPSYKGMIPIGTGFTFGKKDPTPPFFIGLRYDSVPNGFSRNKIFMYRDSAGLLLLEQNCVNDSVHNVVYVKTSNLEFPFMLMIDTIMPTIEFVNNTDTSKIFSSGQDICDYALLKDNIANVSWKFLYGKGDDLYRYADSGKLTSTQDTVLLKISSTQKIINQDNGVRALLIVNDGPNTETANISKRASREFSDAVITVGEKWTPLFVTADSAETSPDSVIRKLSETSVYDKRYVRLFRWVPIAENETKEDRWIEYGDSTAPASGIFDFVPGRLFWVKTLKSRPVNFGSGVTLSLKDTFLIKLPPHNYTDFALPFRFSVRISDILESTNKGNPKKPADSLEIYRFDNSSGIYTTNDLYNPLIGERTNINDSLVYGNENGFSVYNPWKDTVVLKIPPTPMILSTNPLKKKLNESSWWAVKVNYTDANGNALPAVYCSYLPGSSTGYLPVSPSFLTSRVLVYDSITKRTYNHFVTGKIPEDGFSKEIAFVNKSDVSVKMKYSLEMAGKYPEKFSSLLLNPYSNAWEQTGEVTVAPHSTEYRLLATGTEYFQNSIQTNMISLRYALLSPYPNPFRSSVRIRFTVPYGSNDKININIFDLAGKKIWERKFDGHLQAGEHFVVWNGKGLSNNKSSAGIYLSRMTVLEKKGKVLRQFTSRLSLIQ